ncbi:hypothetical protein COCSUDRAFT_36767 [Coccomyxa subellipsoidea C-169]|uniref:Uncharacterized protein n=1 Tax=Coccomyxa subellipsoidea (strain C-169) TaxID=574566 RepID=I0YW13_COCSC|nr:hypothetical protein COCSUDRAFT_36767 [Coccomyxa subellipsoidea C-169]EIE22582.1 hypothetical protein COCSUDRAFT_36767 [Coccomyxa subellipsoidea C-169]|eukprot:XP_005647126.1 hypothetical protein COCSUDRAFT_36767 [Coccomyxa subellipsoidea C-169]
MSSYTNPCQHKSSRPTDIFLTSYLEHELFILVFHSRLVYLLAFAEQQQHEI